MKTQLFIWPGGQLTDPIRWLEWSPKAHKSISAGTLSDSAALSQLHSKAQQATTALLLPGECCLYSRVKLPNRSKLALQSIPYQLEENLCQPLDGLQIATGPVTADLHIPVIALEKKLLQDWLDALKAAQIQVDRIMPDYLALSPRPGQATLLQDQHRVICRLPKAAASFDQRTLSAWWALLEQPDSVQSFGEIELSGAEKHPLRPEESPLSVLARQFDPTRCINLLQADFEQHNPVKDWALRLKTPLIAASILAALHLGTVQLDNMQLQQQISDYDARIKTVFLDAFPDTRRIVNPRSQMKARLDLLARQSDQGGFLRILRQVAPELADSPGITLQTLRFQADTAALQMQLTGPDFAALETFNGRLQKKPLILKPGASQQTADKQISTQLTVRENKGA
ncbi:MAG: type II secretion system protein GspL [Pontibacterium sp.]